VEGRTGESVGGESKRVGRKSESVEGKSVGGQKESVTRGGDCVPSPRGSDALSSDATIHSNILLQHTNSPSGSDASSPHSSQDGREAAHSPAAKKKQRQVCMHDTVIYARHYTQKNGGGMRKTAAGMQAVRLSVYSSTPLFEHTLERVS